MDEEDDAKNIDHEAITEPELDALMIRRLDHRLQDIFLKTELFFMYHKEVDSNLNEMRVQAVSKNFV